MKKTQKTKRKQPWCVQHRRGWCVIADQRKRAYADNIPTACGYVVILTGGIERREPTCKECPQ